jgi:DNA-binding NarL/FixJ family response regulator
MEASEDSQIRVLLVDDHQILLDGLKDLIDSNPAMKVVGGVSNSSAACQAVSDLVPDVVVLDLALGKEDGLDLIPQVLALAPSCRILILTGVSDFGTRDRAMELGAAGVVLKQNGAMELLNAIEKVHRTGEFWLEPGAAKRLMERGRTREAVQTPAKSGFDLLTSTERQIVMLIGEALDNREISRRLHIAESTVRNNLSRIYDKLGINGRLELLTYAYRNHLIDPPD